MTVVLESGGAKVRIGAELGGEHPAGYRACRMGLPVPLRRLRERLFAPALSCLGDALAERLHGAEVGGGDALDALISVGLRHRTDRRAQAIEVLDGSLGMIVAARQAEPDP